MVCCGAFLHVCWYQGFRERATASRSREGDGAEGDGKQIRSVRPSGKDASIRRERSGSSCRTALTPGDRSTCVRQ